MAWLSVDEVEGLLEAFRSHVNRVERLEKDIEARIGSGGGVEALREVVMSLRVFESRLAELVELMRSGRTLEASIVACDISRRSYEIMEGGLAASHRGARSVMASTRPILARIYYVASQLCRG